MFIFQIKNSQLGAVAKAELVQNRAQVVSHRSFAQVQVLGNLFVAHALGDQGNDFQLSGTDVVGFPGKTFLPGQEMREFCGNLVSIDRLPGVHSFQGGNDAVVVLLPQLDPGAELPSADGVFVIQKGSRQGERRLGIKGRDLCRRSQPGHIFPPDIHQKYVRTERIVESDRL